VKKQFNKIHKSIKELTVLLASTKSYNITEDDLDILAESIDLLNDTYEILYDDVFVEVEE